MGAIRLMGTRVTGKREQVDTAESVEEALKLAKLYLTDPKDDWQTIQFWDEMPQCRGWLTRAQVTKQPAPKPAPKPVTKIRRSAA